jgi:hypothetical protein
VTIEKRIEKLEQHTGANETRVTIVYVCNEGDSEAERDTARGGAIAEYKAQHPDWEPSSDDQLINYIIVGSEEAKELTQQIIDGKLPGESHTQETL